MLHEFSPLYETAKILVLNDKEYLESSHKDTLYGPKMESTVLLLEDVNSPVTKELESNLFRSVLDKAHIDFGNIPMSKGNIRDYSGYSSMIKTLETMEGLSKESQTTFVQEYIDIIKTAINNIANLSSLYQKGFNSKTPYVALEYNTYVFTCVQATTALLYCFVDVFRNPDSDLMHIRLKTNKLRADQFYFDQLRKFNNVIEKNGTNYRKMLEKMCDGDKDNFIGAETLVGLAVISAVLLSIVPVTRELIYQIYRFRTKVSDCLELQAKFLELNQACLESNSTMDAKKKTKVLAKQKDLATKLRKLSDVLSVKANKSISEGKADIEKDNKKLNVENLRNNVSDSAFELI